MGDEELAGIARELYALPLEDFVAARTQAAKSTAGSSRELAARIRTLPKPSVAAWAVNMLAVHRPGAMQDLADLGRSMREAQEALDAVALRELAQERRKLLSVVVNEARAVAEEQGRKLSDPVAAEVEETLRAATADEGAAAAVQSGRLLRVLSANGVDTVDLGDAVAVPSVLVVQKAPARVGGRAADRGRKTIGKRSQQPDGGLPKEEPLAVAKAPGGEVPGGKRTGGRLLAGEAPAQEAPGDDLPDDRVPAAKAPGGKPRLQAVRSERRPSTPSVLERAKAVLDEADKAARAAEKEVRKFEAQLEKATADVEQLTEETRKLREQLKRLDASLDQARRRRETTAAEMKQAARVADKGRRAAVLARERVLRLSNTPG
jgi:hypothetical protein